MAHSDIFLCGQSNDAMLATGVYSVIKKEKRELSSLFPCDQLSRKHPHILGLVRDARAAETKRDLSEQTRTSSGGEKCVELEPRMGNN